MADRVLIIEDDDALRDSIAQSVELADWIPMPMSSYVQAKRHIRSNFPGVILTDIHMPHQDGFHILNAVVKAVPELPVILMTGYSDVPTAVRALKDGAWDYLEKPFPPDKLVEVLKRALQHRRETLQIRKLEKALDRHDPAAINFPGNSSVSQRLRKELRNKASMRQDFYIYGEPASGQRQAAYVLNQLSEDHIPLLRYSYKTNKDEIHLEIDKFEGACDLICYHYEILDNKEKKWLKSLKDHYLDLRIFYIITDSVPQNLQLDDEQVQPYQMIYIPSLSERKEDIIDLFEMVLRQVVRSLDLEMPTIHRHIENYLLAQKWRNNLSSLKTYAQNYALMVHSDRYEGMNTSLNVDQLSLNDHLEIYEKQLIVRALIDHNGRAVEAAKSLSIPRNTFYDRLSKHNLNPKAFRV